MARPRLPMHGALVCGRGLGFRVCLAVRIPPGHTPGHFVYTASGQSFKKGVEHFDPAMNTDASNSSHAKVNRRSFLATAMAGSVLARGAASAERDWTGEHPIRYPAPDVVVLDKRFAKYKVSNAAIERLYTGLRWAEGPAWNGGGRYLVWSDIPNNVHMRWLAEDGHVSIFHNPSGNANGNTFDWEGRLLSCEQGTRRVVRYEHNGSVTVLADKWQG